MSDQKAWIEQIRQGIDASRTARIWVDSVHLLSTISQSIFSRSAHFILELLQNAEDAGSKAGTGRGEMEIRISPSRIQVSHDGGSFSKADVDAICGVRSNKKPEQGTLGYLGIGFKSVFRVSDCPQIHSGGFHFKFDKNMHPYPANELWQIMPVWVDEVPDAQSPNHTMFIMPFRNPEAYTQTLEELEKLDVHIFLFLRWLRKLRITNEATGKSTIIENLGEKDKVISLRKDGLVRRFVIFRRTSRVDPELARDPPLEFYKRQTVKQREIVLAFGVDDDGNLQPIEDASTLGSVSSFLPLVEEKSGAKFLIQSDFLVQPGREAIQYELSWNHWLVSEAAELAKEAIEEFKKNSKWRNQFLPIFKFTPFWGQPSFEKLFKPRLHDPLTTYLLSAEIYPTASGRHLKPEQVVQVDDKLQGLVTDADLPHIFSGRTDLSLADPKLDLKAVPEDVQRLVQRVSIEQLARNKDFLEKKRNSPDHVQWFKQFYSAMADTNQNFRYPPIYVLTDKNEIAPADKVSLRQIPSEVLKLRDQFPEVARLLSSYQLIHPELETSKLSKFFGESTNVQSIDFDKICREVFHPKISIDAPAPPREELIAYTRLLQKGPPITGSIVWVVTKEGDVKPSNQVFLGTEYSPSEDWEKNARYSPEIAFLSAEYLQGVQKEEVTHHDSDGPTTPFPPKYPRTVS